MRSAAAAATPAKTAYGFGTAIRASTAPVAVALTSAAVASDAYVLG